MIVSGFENWIDLIGIVHVVNDFLYQGIIPRIELYMCFDFQEFL